MIQAVIFDLDNTLLDFMTLKRASCESAIDAMIDAGLNVSKHTGLKVLFELYDRYGIEHKEIFQKFLMNVMGKVDHKILAEGIVAYRRIKEGYLHPYPGVFSTLIELKKRGIKTAILSDAPRMRAWTRLASLRLSEFFDVVVTYEDVMKYKPNPKGFEIVLRKLKVRPQNTLMVGDWPQRDIKGANALGIRTAYARYGATRFSKTIKADYVLKHVKDILKVIDRESKRRNTS
ncbi:MAG: HAD-IA family hydrolase [DPANN group archaeon]|nr:HAD-IA family hydrolase [DPANN group archaeon]